MWQAENLGSLLDSKVPSAKAVTQLHRVGRERKAAPSKARQGAGRGKSDKMGRTTQTHLCCVSQGGCHILQKTTEKVNVNSLHHAGDGEEG